MFLGLKTIWLQFLWLRVMPFFLIKNQPGKNFLKHKAKHKTKNCLKFSEILSRNVKKMGEIFIFSPKSFINLFGIRNKKKLTIIQYTIVHFEKKKKP